MAMGSVEGALGKDARDSEESPSLRSQVGGGGGLPGGEGVLLANDLLELAMASACDCGRAVVQISPVGCMSTEYQ